MRNVLSCAVVFDFTSESSQSEIDYDDDDDDADGGGDTDSDSLNSTTSSRDREAQICSEIGSPFVTNEGTLAEAWSAASLFLSYYYTFKGQNIFLTQYSFLWNVKNINSNEVSILGNIFFTFQLALHRVFFE